MLLSVSQTKCPERKKHSDQSEKSIRRMPPIKGKKKMAAALSPTLPAKDTGPTLLAEYSRAPERAAAPQRLERTWETRAAGGE